MIPFAKLAYGAIFQTRTGRWRKIFPTPNTDRRGLPPWNAVLVDPPTIHPNLWKQAEHDARLAIELNTLAVSPVYGTFLDGFLVTPVDEASAPVLLSMPAAIVLSDLLRPETKPLDVTPRINFCADAGAKNTAGN